MRIFKATRLLVRNNFPSYTSFSSSRYSDTSRSESQTGEILRISNHIHRDNGPAIYLDDGRVLYCWHGWMVPEWFILNPEVIDIKLILRTGNMELKRLLIERYGEGKFLAEVGGEQIAEDTFGKLWKIERENFGVEDANFVRELFGEKRSIIFAEVKDASTDRIYFLQVPSTMKTPKEAIAWSFKMKKDEYDPIKQT